VWLVTALISLAGFAVAALTLPFLTWKTSKVFQYSCCPVAVLPETLVTFFTVLYWFFGYWVFSGAWAGSKSRHTHRKPCSFQYDELS